MNELEQYKQELEELIQFIEAREDSKYLYEIHNEHINYLEKKISTLENGS